MPAPSSLQTARIQFFSALAFIVAGSIFFLSNVISRVELLSLYRTAIFFSVVHYSVALYESLPEFSLKPEILEKAISSPHLSILLLSGFFWLTRDTFTLQIVPMMVYCAFRAIDIANKDPEIQNNIYWKVHGKRIVGMVAPRRHLLLNLSAHLEIFTLVLILVSLLRFKGSFIQLAVFTQYLVVQYSLSPIMKSAVITWDQIIHRLIADPRCPPAIKAAEVHVKDFLSRLSTTTTQHMQAPQQ